MTHGRLAAFSAWLVWKGNIAMLDRLRTGMLCASCLAIGLS